MTRRALRGRTRRSRMSSGPLARRTHRWMTGCAWRGCGGRSREDGVAQAKGEVGRDAYEVRGWPAWHRQVTFCLLAQAARAVLCASARQVEEAGVKGGLTRRPELSALTGPEVRRLLRVSCGPPTRRAGPFSSTGLVARAPRSPSRGQARPHRTARRARERGLLPRSSVILTLPRGEVSDAEWERVRLVLPPQKPRTGRPRYDQRTVLRGVASAGCSARPPRGARCCPRSAQGIPPLRAIASGARRACGTASSLPSARLLRHPRHGRAPQPAKCHCRGASLAP